MSTALRAGVAITHRDRLPSSSRYELLVKIASGGMATVYVGRQSSVVGTSRLVAIKRAHAHLLEDPAFSKMLIAEAKLASRIHHPNVVAVQNVEELEGELLLVMDYVEGASMADLWGYEEVPLPARVAVRNVLDACAGLQAAHELTDDDGRPLGIVHRDVSPHNILVGVDGVARLTDFGIAKSSGGHTGSAGQHTTTGALKGKVAYMAPEYVESGKLDARSDVFALGVVLWEALTRERLFRGANEVESLKLVLAAHVPRASEVAPWVGKGLDDVLAKALARSPNDRFATAAEMADALETAARREDLIATASQAGAYVKKAAGEALARRRTLIREKSDQSATANAQLDPETREKIAAALAASENPVVTATIERPFGRAEQTAPLDPSTAVEAVADSPRAQEDPSASEVRVRDSGTAPFDVPAAAVVDAALAVPDGGTAGSGVSAGLVDDARRSTRTSGRGRGWMVAIALVAATGIGVAALAGLRVGGGAASGGAATSSPASVALPGATSPVTTPSGTAAATVAAPASAVTNATLPATASAVTTATAPATASAVTASVPSAPNTTPATPALASAAPASAPRGTSRGKPTPAATPAKPAGTKPPAAPAELPADKAPPNPYAH
ncbi:MAG: serine/threonine protein kinase [Deltaproteobacteria bacterium]|nr:serine/threonine protein kinase [Deltaproteobacteria bacterium]